MVDQLPAAPPHTPPLPSNGKGTIMLVSGELDKAILAFEIAAAFQAMGMQVSMWFVLYGINCLKKPKPFLSPAKWWPKKDKFTPGRNPENDVLAQRLFRALNPEGAQHLPLSQLNFGGIGARLMRHIMDRKGICQLEGLVRQAQDLGVRFTICQICVDAMSIEAPDDLIVDAQVGGVSRYYLEVAESHYNAVF